MIYRSSSLVLCALALSFAALAGGCSAAPDSSTSDASPINGKTTGDAGPSKAAQEQEDAGFAPPTEYVDAATPELTILPLKAFSGFDGMHSFQVPIGVYGGGSDLTLTPDLADDVTIAPSKLNDPSGDDGVYFMVTAKAAGIVTLTAASNGKTISAKLTITAYTADEYAAGAARYMNGEGTEPACTTCHSGPGGIDHSPAAMGSAADGDVLRVVLSGVLVAGNPITAVKHKWTLTDAEQKGIVPYLRALAPRGFDGN